MSMYDRTKTFGRETKYDSSRNHPPGTGRHAHRRRWRGRHVGAFPWPLQYRTAGVRQPLTMSNPPEIAELLGACRGFYGTVEQVEFTGRDLMFEFEQAFPYGLLIAADGYGNFWVLDLHPDTTKWGSIYFACHDAPVILYQAGSLEQFLLELFRMFQPPHQSLIDDVHEDRLAHVWQTTPGVLSHEQCLRSGDPILSAFARELDESFQIIDLRLAKPGDGFSWGRYGPKTQIQRFGTHAVFAYKKPKSIITQLLGRAG